MRFGSAACGCEKNCAGPERAGAEYPDESDACQQPGRCVGTARSVYAAPETPAVDVGKSQQDVRVSAALYPIEGPAEFKHFEEINVSFAFVVPSAFEELLENGTLRVANLLCA